MPIQTVGSTSLRAIVKMLLLLVQFYNLYYKDLKYVLHAHKEGCQKLYVCFFGSSFISHEVNKASFFDIYDSGTSSEPFLHTKDSLQRKRGKHYFQYTERISTATGAPSKKQAQYQCPCHKLAYLINYLEIVRNQYLFFIKIP